MDSYSVTYNLPNLTPLLREVGRHLHSDAWRRRVGSLESTLWPSIGIGLLNYIAQFESTTEYAAEHLYTDMVYAVWDQHGRIDNTLRLRVVNSPTDITNPHMNVYRNLLKIPFTETASDAQHYMMNAVLGSAALGASPGNSNVTFWRYMALHIDKVRKGST